jgi:predicted nucleic acid-binding protein
VRGYLLDANHVSAWEREDPNFIKNFHATPADHLLWISAVTAGEAFVVREVHPQVLSVTVTTRMYYAEIMEGIWRTRPPLPGKRTEAHLAENGVDINDVWAVASALEHGLIFLTTDRMTVVRDAVSGKVVFGNWLI